MELKQKKSYGYLMKSLKIGEEIGDNRLIGYACAWLSFTCVSWGRLAEGLAHAKRALEIAKELKNDLYLYYKPIAGIAFASQFTGHTKDCRELGQLALSLGHEKSNPRSMAIGYISLGTANLIAGDHPAAISDFRNAIEIAGDPFYKHWAVISLAQSLVLNEQFEEAEEHLSEINSLSLKLGWEESLGWLSQTLMAVINIAKGNLRWGLETVKKQIAKSMAIELKPWTAMFEYVVGKVYLQMATGRGPRDFRFVMQNFVFLVRNLPFAGQKSEYHLKRAIEASKEAGAIATLSQAYFDLALLYKAKKRVDEAKNCLYEAIRIFEQCSAEVYLRKAQEALSSLD
jgi:tetratricopeptide (TPR) repeat protein